jgi:hypothetical protein
MNLVKPDDYFGAQRFFGAEGDEEGVHVILHPEETAEEIMEVELTVETNIEDTIPPALKEAMMDFILTGAVNTTGVNKERASIRSIIPCLYMLAD